MMATKWGHVQHVHLGFVKHKAPQRSRMQAAGSGIQSPLIAGALYGRMRMYMHTHTGRARPCLPVNRNGHLHAESALGFGIWAFHLNARKFLLRAHDKTAGDRHIRLPGICRASKTTCAPTDICLQRGRAALIKANTPR